MIDSPASYSLPTSSVFFSSLNAISILDILLYIVLYYIIFVVIDNVRANGWVVEQIYENIV